jgi:histidinol phosphatase-like PHP family hydrolase
MMNLDHRFIFNADSLINEIPSIDSHIHTNWTDGENSVDEIYGKAKNLELSRIVFTEHSSKVSESWFNAFADEVNMLPSSNTDVYIGTEVRICNLDGEIEILDSISNRCELILASVHRFPDIDGNLIEFSAMSVDKVVGLEFSLMKSAIMNSQANVIAHPFGMSFSRFNLQPTLEMWLELIELSRKHGVALEINSKYHKNFDYILSLFIQEKALISIGSDVHEIDRLGSCVKKIESFLSAI